MNVQTILDAHPFCDSGLYRFLSCPSTKTVMVLSVLLHCAHYLQQQCNIMYFHSCMPYIQLLPEALLQVGLYKVFSYLLVPFLYFAWNDCSSLWRYMINITVVICHSQQCLYLDLFASWPGKPNFCPSTINTKSNPTLQTQVHWCNQMHIKYGSLMFCYYASNVITHCFEVQMSLVNLHIHNIV